MFIELRLSNIRLGRHGDAADDEDPTTSGRYSGGLFSGRFSGRSTASDIPDSMVSKAPKVLMTLTSLTLFRLTIIERNYDQISERTLVNNFKCLIFYIISFVWAAIDGSACLPHHYVFAEAFNRALYYSPLTVRIARVTK
jgi:hypothetical protein